MNPCKDCKKPFSCNIMNHCLVEQAEKCLASVAKEVWETAYPDRNKWEQLAEDTKKEWIKFVRISQSVLLKNSML